MDPRASSPGNATSRFWNCSAESLRAQYYSPTKDSPQQEPADMSITCVAFSSTTDYCRNAMSTSQDSKSGSPPNSMPSPLQRSADLPSNSRPARRTALEKQYEARPVFRRPNPLGETGDQRVACIRTDDPPLDPNILHLGQEEQDQRSGSDRLPAG